MSHPLVPYGDSEPDRMKWLLGLRGQAPSRGNAYGAIEAPTLDPTRRPDVLRVPDPNEPGAGEQHSSLWSSSDGTDKGERLVPQISSDGRVIQSRDEAQALADKTGEHLGIYSSPDMADQAAITMHNEGAQQMQSPSFRPTMRTREDTPGARYANAADQSANRPLAPSAAPAAPAAPVDPKREAMQAMFGGGSAPASGYTPPQGAPNSTWHDIQGFAAGFAGPEYLRMFQQRDQNANAAAANAALKDPRSPQSVQARAAAAPFLQKMGFAPEDIARLSVADINGAGGLASLMKQAAALKAAEAKAKESEATWQSHNQTTSGQVDARNHEMAQATLGREQEMAGTQHKFATEQQARGADLSLRNSETLAAEAEQRQIEKEARKAAAGTKAQQDLTENYRKANDYLDFRDPELLASAYQSRGKNKLNTDIQNASVIHHASRDISTARDEALKAATEAASGDLSKVAVAYAKNQKFNLAVNKAADALVALGGNSSDAAKKAALAKFPSIANPFGGETLGELQDELDNIIDDKIGSAYGGFVKRGGAKPAAAAPNLGTAPAGPKAVKVVAPGAVKAAGGTLHLSDGSSAPDTAANRELIKKAGLTFEPENASEDASEPGEEQ